MYPDYLVHFNGNHSSKNGRFTNGDGDNDGIVDDHHNYSRNKGDLSDVHKQQAKAITSDKRVQRMAGKAVVGAGKAVANIAFKRTKLGKAINEAGFKDVTREFSKAIGGDKLGKSTGLKDLNTDLQNKVYDKIGSKAAKVANKAIDQDFKLTDSQARKAKTGLIVGGAVAGTAATSFAASSGARMVKPYAERAVSSIINSASERKSNSGKMFANDYKRASAAKIIGGDW